MDRQMDMLDSRVEMLSHLKIKLVTIGFIEFTNPQSIQFCTKWDAFLVRTLYYKIYGKYVKIHLKHNLQMSNDAPVKFKWQKSQLFLLMPSQIPNEFLI